MSMEDAGLAYVARVSGVRDKRVLAAVGEVPRHLFVPDDQVRRAALDTPLPLPCGQTTSQPSLIAQMVEALRLTESSTVLEVGTGYGYEAAILSRLAAEVWTVEYVAELAAAATRNLAAFGAANVHVVVGDGRAGLSEHAPYDGIVVAAQAVRVPAALLAQLAVGGRLVAPIGLGDVQRCVVLRRATAGTVEEVGDLGLVNFVPLVGTD